MITMVIDHIGWTFLENPMLLTWIGRIAFPIYAFLLAEGFRFVHTDRDRLTKHLSIMLILAVVSEPAFDLMDIGLDFAHYLDSQSNMITLLFGYLGLLATEALAPSAQAEGKRGSVMRTTALICAYGLLGFANYMAHGNFNIVGPWLIIAFLLVHQRIREGRKRRPSLDLGKTFPCASLRLRGLSRTVFLGQERVRERSEMVGRGGEIRTVDRRSYDCRFHSQLLQRNAGIPQEMVQPDVYLVLSGAHVCNRNHRYPGVKNMTQAPVPV